MRLSQYEIKAIVDVFKQHFSEQDAIWLFGSRVDDSRRGGDIDLLIETHHTDKNKQFKQKMHFLIDLENKIGEQKIDVVICTLQAKENLPICKYARETGVKLL